MFQRLHCIHTVVLLGYMHMYAITVVQAHVVEVESCGPPFIIGMCGCLEIIPAE